MDINPKEIYENLVTLGTEWAQAKYAHDLLEDARKPLLAKLGAQSNQTTQSAKESYAYSHESYAEHCQKAAEAARIEAIAKVRYNSAITYADLMRTVAANERAANRVAT